MHLGSANDERHLESYLPDGIRNGGCEFPLEARSFYMRLLEAFATQPKPVIVFEITVATVVIGWVDAASGWEFSVFLVYALPILAAAWTLNTSSAVVVSLVAGIVWFIANYDPHPYSSFEAYVWASVNRLGYLLFVAIGGGAMRNERESMRTRMDAMSRMLELEKEIVRVREKEQVRIGRDLHDGLCQNLAAIACATTCLETALKGGSTGPSSLDSLKAIQKMLKESMIEARNVARAINPVHLDNGGLLNALDDLTTSARQLWGVEVQLEIDGEPPVVDDEASVHVYRIVQEALSNSLRHSQTKEIEIHLSGQIHEWMIEVIDHGTGMPHEKQITPGMGLNSMKYRARMLNAALSMEKTPSGGTTVRLLVPNRSVQPLSPNFNHAMS